MPEKRTGNNNRGRRFTFSVIVKELQKAANACESYLGDGSATLIEANRVKTF